VTPVSAPGEASPPERPQLHMGRPLGWIEPLAPPPGYELARVSASAAAALAEVLDGTGELGEWDEERARRLFECNGDAVTTACFLATVARRPVATAQLGVHRRGRYGGLAELGWVGVVPGERGRRLGTCVTEAVIAAAFEQGRRELFLRTDDWRLPAIASYVQMGFRPWIVDPSAPERWRQVGGQLRARRWAAGELLDRQPFWQPEHGGPEAQQDRSGPCGPAESGSASDQSG
jgi:mycothiol synthase